MEPKEMINELADVMKSIGGVEKFKDFVSKATDNSTGFSTRQSLSDTIADITRKTTPLFDMLPREEVISTIHQWDAITSLATGISSYAQPIDSNGSDSDPILTRYSEAIKYYATTTTVGQFTGAVSRPNLGAQATVDEKAVQSLREALEDDIIQGATGGNNIRGINDVISNFSGSANSVDGGSVAMTSTANLDEVQRVIYTKNGRSTHFLFNPEDKVDFRNIFSDDIRYNDPQSVDRFGYTVMKYMSPFDEVDVLTDTLIDAKATTSTAYVVDITTWALGEIEVNGASGVAMQDLAKTGPKNTKLINYYGTLVYHAPQWNGRVTNLG